MDADCSMSEADPELSSMVQELWNSDTNRLKPGIDYRISLQVRRWEPGCSEIGTNLNQNHFAFFGGGGHVK